MAGFNTLVKDFADATCEMHLMSSSGLPVYGVQKKAGGMDVATGLWEETGETVLIGQDKHGNDVYDPILEARAPTVGDVLNSGYVIAEGDIVKPTQISLRCMQSPDVKRFKEKNECTIKPTDMVQHLRGKILFDVAKNDKGEDIRVIRKLEEKDIKVFWASLIADFVNLPYENEDGKTVLATYSEENAMDFIELMPGIVHQMKDIVFDAKKYERSNING